MLLEQERMTNLLIAIGKSEFVNQPPHENRQLDLARNLKKIWEVESEIIDYPGILPVFDYSQTRSVRLNFIPGGGIEQDVIHIMFFVKKGFKGEVAIKFDASEIAESEEGAISGNIIGRNEDGLCVELFGFNEARWMMISGMINTWNCLQTKLRG